MSKCINCGFFLNCNEAEENKNDCQKFIKQQRGVPITDNKTGEVMDYFDYIEKENK